MTDADEASTTYPKTGETQQGLTVDESIVTVVERVIDLGLTPRASCSGLDRDHAPDTDATPYLTVQVAPTFEQARQTTTLPAEYRDIWLLQRLQAVGDRADWTVGDGVTWLLYPTATFRLAPTRGDLKNQLYGRDRDFDDLSTDEENRLDYRYDELQADADALSDDEITAAWDDLLDALTQEFSENPLPQFDDNEAAFEAAQEQWPEIFEVLFASDDELIEFYE